MNDKAIEATIEATIQKLMNEEFKKEFTDLVINLATSLATDILKLSMKRVVSTLYETGGELKILTAEELNSVQHQARFGPGTTQEEWNESAYQTFASKDNNDLGTLYKLLMDHLANEDNEAIKKTYRNAYNKRSKELMNTK